MKAVAVWPARRRIDVVERAAPTIDSDTAVRFRVLDVGVCGTDAEICRFDYGGTPPAGEEDLVVGHEALGQVIETGSRGPSDSPKAALAEKPGAAYLSSSEVPVAEVAKRMGGIHLYRGPGTEAPHRDLGRRDHAQSRPPEPDRARHRERRTSGFRVRGR